MTGVVAVAGMHRSGTSLTASWLRACGLPIAGGRVIEAGVGNERGHFEDADFVAFHHRVIERCVPGSRGWVLAPQDRVSMGLTDRFRARRLVRSRRRTAPVWGWKDPRTTVLLGDWQRIVPDLLTLGIWRPRSQVVASLLRRAAASDEEILQIAEGEARSTWEFYNRALLEHQAQHPDRTVIVSIADLVESPRGVFDVLMHRLDGSFRYRSLEPLLDPGHAFRDAPADNRIERSLRDVSLATGSTT